MAEHRLGRCSAGPQFQKFRPNIISCDYPKPLITEDASSVLLGTCTSAKGVKCTRYKNIVYSSDTFVNNSDGIKKDYRLKSALK